MALFLATVARWQADSWKRVRNTTLGTEYLLNTNRLDSIQSRLNGTVSTLYYFDNPFDERDRGNYMILAKTVAELIAYFDTPLAHNYLTLAMYKNNNHDLATTDTDISVANFAYAVADANSATRSWVTYSESGWNLKTVLVNHTLAAILAMV